MPAVNSTPNSRSGNDIFQNPDIFHQILDALADCVIIATSSGIPVKFNSQACKFLKIDSMIPLHIEEYFKYLAQDYKPPWKLISGNGDLELTSPADIFKILVKKHILRDGYLYTESRDGDPLWLNISAVPLKIHNADNLTYYLVIIRDVTESKKTELSLRELNEFNTSLLENSFNPIIVHNPDTSIRYVNPSMERLVGYSRSEIIGIKAPYPWWHPDDIPNLIENLQEGLSKTSRIIERRYRRKDGEIIWVELNGTPIIVEGKTRYLVTNLVDITERKRLKDEMEYYIREIIRIQEEERKRISRELHDDTAQALSYLALELDALATRPEIASQDILTGLERLKQLSLNALQEVRRFIHELRPGVLDQLGLVAALELIVEEFNARNQIQIEFQKEGEERRLSAEEEQSLFRIAQEALNNIYKHSQANHASVKLRFDSQSVSLEIYDNGKGFSTSDMDLAISKGRLGLLGMRERAKLINAQLKIISAPNCGTTVRVELSA